MREVCVGGGTGYKGKSLYLPLNFTVNLKWLQKKFKNFCSSLKKKYIQSYVYI